MAALNVGSAFATFSLKLQGVNKSAKKATAAMGRIERSAGRASAKITAHSKRMDKAFGGIEKSSRKMRNVGLVIGAALGFIGAKTISAASDLEETQGKFDVVFRGMTESAEGWSQTLRKSYAMSETESKKYLSSIQDLVVPTGMARDEAGKLSNQFVTMAADLGSFNNLPTDQVVRDIQSALQGGSETMAKYGINVKMAKVEQEILNQGWAKSKKEITDAHKAQAIANIIMKDGADAMGDMARTSESFANQQKKLSSRFEDLQTSLGKAFLPIITKIVEKLTPVIEKIGNWIEKNPELTKMIVIVIAVLAGLLLVLGAIGLIIGPIAAAFAFLASPIGLIILGIIASIAQFYLLWKVWKFIINKIKSVFKGLVSFFKTGDLSGEFLRALGVHEDGKIVAFLFFIRESFMAMKEAIRNIFSSIKEIVTGAWTATGNALSATWEFIKTIFRVGVSIILKILSPWIWVFQNILMPLFMIVAIGLKIAFDFMAAIVTSVSMFIANILKKTWGYIATFLFALWVSIYNKAIAIWTPIKNFLVELATAISGFILGKWRKLKAELMAIWRGIMRGASAIWGKISAALISPVIETHGRLSSKFDDIKNMIGDKVQGWIDIAKEKISGMWGAISGKLTAFKEKIEGWADSIHDAFTRAFDKDEKGSPSVMMNVKDMVNGVNSLIHSGFEMPDIHGRLVEEFDFADVGGNTSNVNITNNNNVGDGVDANMLAERMAFQINNTR